MIVPCTDPRPTKAYPFPSICLSNSLDPEPPSLSPIPYPSLLMSHECDIGIVLPLVTKNLPYYEPTLTLL